MIAGAKPRKPFSAVGEVTGAPDVVYTRMTSLMTSRTRVLPLPSEPTHSPWSGGSRLNWFPPADEPNRWSKWSRPAKLVRRFGFEVVTGVGWVMAPTGVPPELWLRSGASA